MSFLNKQGLEKIWEETATYVDEASAIQTVISMESTDGVNYTATVPGITELYDGLTIRVKPNMTSTSPSVTLTVNGLASKTIRIRSYKNGFVGSGFSDDWILKDKIYTLVYSSSIWCIQEYYFREFTLKFIMDGDPNRYNVRTIQAAENSDTYTLGHGAFAQGNGTKASGNYSHAEGVITQANGDSSHAEGMNTQTNGGYSHAEGYSTQTNAAGSHAEGYNTQANGGYSHAEGHGTKAGSRYQHVEGRYNIEDTEEKYVHIIGNGSGEEDPSNAYTLDWDGNAWFKGDVYVGGTSQTSGSEKLVKQSELNSALANVPTFSGDYNDLTNKPTIPSTASDIGAAPATHNQAASTITAGTFAGAVVAQSSTQTTSSMLLRNSKLVTTETNPSNNGEICWMYE